MYYKLISVFELFTIRLPTQAAAKATNEAIVYIRYSEKRSSVGPAGEYVLQHSSKSSF